MMRRLSLLLLICFLGTNGFCQSFMGVWKNALKPFYADCFDIELKLTIYTNAFRIGVLESTDLHYRKSGKQLLVLSQEFDQLVNEKLMILADHQEQLLMLGPRFNKKGAEPLLGLDSLLSITTSIFDTYGFVDPLVLKGKDGGLGYVFREPNDYYEQAEFWFTPDRLKVVRIVLIPSPNIQEGLSHRNIPSVEYCFKYNNEIPESSLFRMDQFVVKKAGRFSPQKKYSAYTLLNQL